MRRAQKERASAVAAAMPLITEQLCEVKYRRVAVGCEGARDAA